MNTVLLLMVARMVGTTCYQEGSQMSKEGFAGLCVVRAEAKDEPSKERTSDTHNKDEEKAKSFEGSKQSETDSTEPRRIRCLPHALARQHYLSTKKRLDCNDLEIKELVKCVESVDTDAADRLLVTDWLAKSYQESKKCAYEDSEVIQPRRPRSEWQKAWARVESFHANRHELSQLLNEELEAFEFDKFMLSIKTDECQEVCGADAMPLVYYEPDPEEVKDTLLSVQNYCLKIEGEIYSWDLDVQMKLTDSCKALDLGLYRYTPVWSPTCWENKECASSRFATRPMDFMCTQLSSEGLHQKISDLDRSKCDVYYNFFFHANIKAILHNGVVTMNDQDTCECQEGDAIPHWSGIGKIGPFSPP